MKKFFMVSVIALSALTVNAQSDNATAGKQHDKKSVDKGNRPDATTRATKITEHMAKKLILTAEQKPKVFNINLDKAKKIEALHTKSGADKKGLGKERKAIEQERDTELKGVLTLEQYEKWHKWKEEKKEELKKKRKDKKDKGKDNEDTSESEIMDNIEN